MMCAVLCACESVYVCEVRGGECECVCLRWRGGGGVVKWVERWRGILTEGHCIQIYIMLFFMNDGTCNNLVSVCYYYHFKYVVISFHYSPSLLTSCE